MHVKIKLAADESVQALLIISVKRKIILFEGNSLIKLRIRLLKNLCLQQLYDIVSFIKIMFFFP